MIITQCDHVPVLSMCTGNVDTCLRGTSAYDYHSICDFLWLERIGEELPGLMSPGNCLYLYSLRKH